MSFTKRNLCAFVAALCFVFTPAFAFAAEAPDDVRPSDEEAGEALVKDLDSALRAKEVDAIEDHVECIGDAYGDFSDKDVRRKLIKVVGKASRFKDDDVRKAALRAFAAMKDDAAWKYISPFLKQSDRKKKPALFDQAIQAVEATKPNGAVNVLLGHVQKSKHLGVAALSMKALGAFEDSKYRVKILETIIVTTRKEKPGVKGRENPNYYGPRYTGEEARNRWEALGGPMVETANRLTGQDISSPSEWFQVWGDHKRDPDSLFQSDA